MDYLRLLSQQSSPCSLGSCEFVKVERAGSGGRGRGCLTQTRGRVLAFRCFPRLLFDPQRFTSPFADLYATLLYSPLFTLMEQPARSSVHDGQNSEIPAFLLTDADAVLTPPGGLASASPLCVDAFIDADTLPD